MTWVKTGLLYQTNFIKLVLDYKDFKGEENGEYYREFKRTLLFDVQV